MSHATVRRRDFMLSGAALLTGCGGGTGDTSDVRQTQYLVITVDTEAQPARQSHDHVKRLMYGDFDREGRAGIIDMMDIADKYGIQLTFFLDVIEEILYPKKIETVAKLIVARNHDLQLHFHLDEMSDSFFTESGVAKKPSNRFNEAEATALLNEVTRIVGSWRVPPFIACRAGGFRYSAGFVKAMPKFNYKFSYNYNILGMSQRPNHLKNVPMSRWENDLIEIPVSCIGDTPASIDVFTEQAYQPPSSPRHAYDLIDKFQDEWISPNVMTMVLHSWSFLYPVDYPATGQQFFEYKDATRMAAFDYFLSSLPSHVKVVSAKQLSTLIASGSISIRNEINTGQVFARG